MEEYSALLCYLTADDEECLVRKSVIERMIARFLQFRGEKGK